MNHTALKKKVIAKIENSDMNVLQVVYNMLNLYTDSDNESSISKEQKLELDKRAILLEKGLIKKRSLKEVNKTLNTRLKEIK